MELKQIYTELIREHSNNKFNKRPLEDKTHTELGHNPSCGDEITLNLKIEDGIVKDASYEGVGCAISQASPSMMVDAIKGKSVEDARELAETFIGMIKGEIEDEEELEKLEDAIVFENIKVLPARVKCAVLAWHTLDEIIKKK
ncbi:MAG: SUF system NifU family Fe-S cluster assembly protein [Tissierellia bacterium]|nr:SUF system NifU family Fe-S cluster assembly protein [Tissierellia bacterium]